MSAARTSPGSSVSHQPQHAPTLGGRDTQAIDVQDNDELPSRLADVIDDRIAEILNELLDERAAMQPQRRLLRALGVLILVLALGASTLLGSSTPAAWMIWASAATVCIAVAWIIKPIKP